MEKRLPLALVLSLLFLWGYMMWVYKDGVPPPQDGVAQEQGALSGSEGPASAPSTGTPGDPLVDPLVDPTISQPATTGGGGGRAAAPKTPPVDQAPARTAIISGPDTRSEWTSRGGSLVWLELTDYAPSPGSDEPLPLLGEVEPGGRSFLLRDVNDRYDLDDSDWHVIESPAGDGSGRLVFQLETADGMLFTRSVAATDDPYILDLSLTVTNGGDERTGTLSLALESSCGVIDEEAGSTVYGAPTALVVVGRGINDPEVISWSGGDLATGQPRSILENETVVAAGAMTNYFASLLVPVVGTDVRQVFPQAVLDSRKLERKVESEHPRDGVDAERWRLQLQSEFRTNASAELSLLVRRLDPGESETFEFRAYSGPKALEVAALPGYGFLTPVIEKSYGKWGWINRTLLQTLRFFHGVFGNWGVAIIVLTILVKTLLFPLNRRQQTSMSKYSAVMQKLKPQLEELKAKYKNNTRKYNEEQMKLVRAEGASPPLGGCLLMFLQFPIWISLFQILGTSIELRQSSFIGWIDDLSRPDAMPLGIAGFETVNLLPLLMAAATMAQMRFQPKPGDDSQAQMQKIMGLMMPVLMLFFLYRYPAGLSLYICTSSLLGIFEFQVIRRIWPVPGMPGSGGNAPKSGGGGRGTRKQGPRKGPGDSELARV